jgi:hypothetical protein
MKIKKYTEEEKLDVPKAHLNILYKIISTVYGYKGNLIYSCDTSDFEILKEDDKVYLSSKIKNTGTTAINTYYKITYYKGDKQVDEEKIRAGKVMRENEKVSKVLLNEFNKRADKMKIEIFYHKKDISKPNKEDEEIKLEEKEFLVEDLMKS